VIRAAAALLTAALGAGAQAEGCNAALGDSKPWVAQGSGARVLFAPRPAPVPVGSPVCAIKPSITRWKMMPL